ncbi:ARM repeat-containing protein [Piedraia hortae CBS 480.64]|uniref:ARM repeat-containing protein n=1 Tax=Piedraia hortae CBS 480.64 TaxID=1314780 RepID=A0A6A7C0A3_9PEZI|nr:ARM repeat-containing protein [Piedraia hortae CBS 480.64]
MQSISRMSLLLETARDLTLEAARDVGPRKPLRQLPEQQIKALLDSRSERDVLDGLRRIISMQYCVPPQPTLQFFPAVLKTLRNPYPSTRPLVYNYLIRHAEGDPDTALLAINTIQKTLTDRDARVRAMALKTIAGIRVPAISQLIVLAIKRGVGDLSPVVRKAAALACVKCVRLDPGTRAQVAEFLATLLADSQYYITGAAVQALAEICPDRLDLIHPVFRSLCRMVVDMDEWGQLALVRLFTFYACRCFPQREQREASEQESEFYMADTNEIDADLKLFLNSIQPLLHSRNAAVIVAVTRAYASLSPTDHLPSAIGPLVALLRAPQDVLQVALHDMIHLCRQDAALFVPYFRHFLFRSTDPSMIWNPKLDMLTLLFPHSTKDVQNLILAELEHFSHSPDAALARASIRTMGRCAQVSDPATARRCLTRLLQQLHAPDSNAAGEAMEVVRHLIQRSPEKHKHTIIRLARNLDSLSSSAARASVIWLVGEYSGGDNPATNVAPDVLRILLKTYADEPDDVREQIILLAAKVYLHHLHLHKPYNTSNLDNQEHQDQDKEKSPIPTLFSYTMLLARYTPSYTLRDRARMFKSLLSTPSSTDLAELLLLAPKPVPAAWSAGGEVALAAGALASASAIVGESIPGFERLVLPERVLPGSEPEAEVRGRAKEVVEVSGRSERMAEGFVPAAGGESNKAPVKSLEEWLADEDEGDSEGESGSEEETESEFESETETETETETESGSGSEEE